MRYAMLIAGDESHWAEGDGPEGLMDEIGAWWEKWAQAGKVVDGGVELQPSVTARTIGRGADGAPVVTDGPYVELKEIIGAVILLEAADLDEAVAVASGWPGIARIGDKVEVRPVMER